MRHTHTFTIAALIGCLPLISGVACGANITTAGTTGICDENTDATNALDIEIPAATLGAFQSAVLAAFNNDLGGVIDWETGVTADASNTTDPKNYIDAIVDASFGTGGGKTLKLTFDRKMALYTNDINSQVQVLSRQGTKRNALVPDGGNAAIGLEYNVAFSGAVVLEIGAAHPSRSTYALSGVTAVNFQATVTYSSSAPTVVNYSVGGTPGTGDTFLHFAAPSGETITSFGVKWVSETGGILLNGQRRPILDDLGFIVAEYPYEAWADGAVFTDDDNGDGVDNGLAWILGATEKNVSALNKLPTVSTPPGFLQLDFTRENPYSPAKLYVEYGNDLAVWTKQEIQGAGTFAGGVEVEVISPGSPSPDSVKVRIPTSHASGTGKLFTRLSATEN